MPEYPIQGDPTPFNHCIYIHRNKVNGKVYVGQATGDPHKRWGINGTNYRKQPDFWQAIQQYGWDNFSHIILEENLTQEEANAREKYWIKELKAQSEGYNRTGGGKGAYHLSEEAAQKKAENMAKYWSSPEGRIQAKRHSEECKGSKNPMYGKQHTKEAKQRISESRLGEKNVNWNKTGVKNHLSKPVYCIELNRFFGSCSEADRFINKSAGMVSKCCNGNIKTAGQYNGISLHWRFATEEEVKVLKEELL